MKKLLIICTTLIMMSSCIEHAHIYQKLTDEDAAYVKHGRTYYYANPNCQITGTDAWRIVYAASSEMMRPAQRNEIFANEFPTHNEV